LKTEKLISVSKNYALKIPKMNRLLLAALTFMAVYQAIAQDLHYSQFYNSPLNLNPAQTGVFNGSHRYNLSWRDQWRFVPVPWQTFSVSWDKNFLPLENKNFYGLGINFNYDRQGDSRLQLAALNISGSITRELNKSNLLSLGALLGGASRGFNTKDLTWDKQWNGDVFNPNAASGEQFDLDAMIFLETGLGINYRVQKSTRTKLDVGISALHLYQPKTNFYKTESKRLPTHFILNLQGSVKLANQIDLLAHGMHQIQAKYQETLLGGLLRIYVSQKRGKEITFDAGIGHRTSGSWYPTVALGFGNWYVSGSYDIDRTRFNQVLSSNRGGPEIHLRYIHKNVRPLGARKVCPIY
jgi:type IX secretion system PorP/SprF family membrane protein